MTNVIIIRSLCTTLLCTPTADHELDADAFPDGTIVNALFAGVRLDVADAAGNPRPDPDVFAFTPRNPDHVSTGTRNFAWQSARGPYDGWTRRGEKYLRIEFALSATSISVDFVGRGGDAAGFLHAFDNEGNRIGALETATFGRPGEIETLLLESATPIGFALAGGLGYDAVSIDAIRYSGWAPQPIPAPGAAMLGIFGMAAIGMQRRLIH